MLVKRFRFIMFVFFLLLLVGCEDLNTIDNINVNIQTETTTETETTGTGTTGIEINETETTAFEGYRIIFESNGGEIIPDITNISYGSTINLPIPEKNGYLFKGWFLGESINAIRIYDKTPIIKDLTLYARWEPEVYTVKFFNEDNLIYVEYVTYGASANEPILPEKEGYTFIGWDKSFVEVEADMNIYAEYQINYYDITFDPNGGTYVDNIEDVQYNTSTELPIPIREGYDFLGWVSYNIASYDKVYNSHSNIKSDLHLIARWAETAYLEFEFNSEEFTYDVSGYYGTQEHVIIPETYHGFKVTHIQTDIFWARYNIISIYIPKTIITMEGNACAFIQNLEEIIVDPENRYFESVEGMLYSEDLSILYVYPAKKTGDTFVFEENVIEVKEYAFAFSRFLKSVYIHKDFSDYRGGWFFASNSLESIIVDSDNPYFTSVDGVLFNKDLSIIYKYPVNKPGTHYVIPDTVVRVFYLSFMDCYKLETIDIPEGLVEIQDRAFDGANILAYNLPETLEFIGGEAFVRNTNLSSITIPENVTFIGTGVFSECPNLTSIFVNEENLFYKSVDGVLFNSDFSVIYAYPGGKISELYIIPDSVVEIPDGVFNVNYNLKYVYIPEQVTTIPINAFNYSDKLSILTEYTQSPVGWEVNWNAYDRNWELYNVFGLDYVPVIYNITECGDYGDFIYYLKTDGTVAIIGKNIESEATDLVIPEIINSYPVNEIRPYAFQDNQTIDTIDVPDTIDIIGENAFADSNTTVNLVDYEAQPGWVENWDRNANINWGDEIRTIAFDSNGGDAVDDLNVIYGTEVTELPVPTRVGYTFGGWYLNEIEINPPFTYDTHDDYTFYAEWNVTTYEITYHLDGGTTGSNPEDYTIETSTITLSNPMKVGYSFDGWYDNEEFTGSPVTEIILGTTGDINLYAKWIINQYTVTYIMDKDYDYIISTSLGADHSLAITYNGRVLTWGHNDYGKLGDGTVIDKNTPTDITSQFNLNEGETIASVSLGYFHSSVITSEGRIFMWGRNNYGQLGDGTTIDKHNPIDITSQFNLVEGEKIVFISLGAYHSSAITSVGRVFTWGYNNTGRLGDGTNTNRIIPTDITSQFNLSAEEHVVFMSLGPHHSSAITSNGKIFTWGPNNYGQLGDGTTFNRYTPTDITSNINLNLGETVLSVSLGHDHSSALTSEGRLFIWGWNGFGQLGDGTTATRIIPTDITSYFNLSEGEKIISIALGAYHSSAISSDNRVSTWGDNRMGQLGDDTRTNKLLPTDITGQFDLNVDEKFESFSLGFYFTSVLTSDNRLFNWGLNELGLLGDGTNIHNKNTPQLLPFDTAYSTEIFIYDYNESLVEYIPVREGYIFDGWYSDESLTTKYSFTTMPAEDITLYGKWIEALDNGEFLYRIQDDNTVMIIGISESNVNTDIVIPGIIDTYPVTVIGEGAFEDNSDITSITIPSSVTEIEYNAFKGMSWLEIVTFEAGSNLQIIGANAFKLCSSLTSINIPEGVTEIGEYAFSYTYMLNTITLPSTLTTIGNNAFEQTWSLDSIIIPLAVTEMGSNVFEGSDIPEINCEVASLPATWETDWNPDEITVNWDYVDILDNGEFLYTIQDNNTVTILGISESNVNTSIVIPNTIDTYLVTTIGKRAFEDNSDITSITIPASVIEIEYNAFNNMWWLATVTFEVSSNLQIIGDYAFKSCSSLTSIAIPEGVTEIGAYAFSYAYGLNTITLPSTLTTIGNNAFEQTWSLDSIIIPLAVTEMGSNVFEGSDVPEINCEVASLPATWETDWNPDLITVNWDYVDILDNGEFLYRILTDNTVIILGISESNVNTSIVIPNTIDTYPVTTIGKRAFEDNSDITSITIPASVIEIEYNAFNNMWWLATVTFEASSNLQIIGDYAFKSCSSLTSIAIPEGVTEIGAYAFSYAYGLNTITLPSTLTTIGNNAFEQTWSLDSIIIPLAVTNMGSNVFYGSSVPEIYCEVASLPATWAVDWNPDGITVTWNYGS